MCDMRKYAAPHALIHSLVYHSSLSDSQQELWNEGK